MYIEVWKPAHCVHPYLHSRGSECLGLNMSKFFQPATLTGAIALALTSTMTLANDAASSDVQLDPIVVTASKTAQKASEVPARINIIQPQIVAQSPIAALPDLLKTDPSLNVVQSGGYGQQTSIFTRGTNSNQTLVLRDGVRLNTATTGAASLPFIDTTDIQQIEVLKGPASVLYGTDAIGGVVQLISKTPEKNAAFVTGEIGENKTYKALVGADLAQDNVYAQIRGQRLETDGTSIFNLNDPRRYSYDQKGYSAKIGTNQQAYAASLDYSQNQGNSQYSNWGTPASQDFKNEIINLKGRINPYQSLEVNARVSQFKDDLDQVTSTSFVHSTTQEAEVYAKYNLTAQQNILAGVTHRNTKANTNAINENVDSTGYYVQHQYQDNGLSSQIGVRVEDNEKFGTHTVAQGGLRYQLLPLTSIYTNIGSAFKAPTLNDMYAFGGNPDLKPEQSMSYEIGVDQQLPFNILLGASAFYIKVDDLITSKCVSTCNGNWVTTFPVYKNLNVDEASMKGGELTAHWKQDQFFTNTGYTYVKTEDEKTGKELLRRPRQSFTLATGIENDQYGISGAFIAKSKSKDFARDVPGYARIDLNMYWNVQQNIKLFANVENVGDVHYKTVHSNADQYYVNGGRQASVGLTLKY